MVRDKSAWVLASPQRLEGLEAAGFMPVIAVTIGLTPDT